MRYKDFYEGYPWGGFSATKDDFEKKSVDDTTDNPKDIAVTSVRVSDVVEEMENPCWDGYEMVGHKMKDGKKVPNCVPVNEEDIIEEYCPRCLATEIVRAAGQPLQEAEYHGRKVSLGKPFRTPGGPKKFSVYVKNKKGNTVKVNFGDPNMKIKKSIPGRRKSFRARHKCHTAKDRTSARYWSCRAW